MEDLQKDDSVARFMEQAAREERELRKKIARLSLLYLSHRSGQKHALVSSKGRGSLHLSRARSRGIASRSFRSR